MRGMMWFGTEARARWVPAPKSPADASSAGWGTSDTYLNGGAFVRHSWGTHKQFIYEWPESSSLEAAQIMKSYRDGSYGRGLLYFIDPLTYRTNILPARWADPSMTVDLEGGSLVGGVDPTAVPTSGGVPNDLPVNSAYYDLASTVSGFRGERESVFIPVPEGYTLHLGAFYASTGTGGVFASPVSSGGVGAAVKLTSVANNATQIVPDKFSGVSGVRLWVGKSGAGAATVTIAGMVARLLPTITSWTYAENLTPNPSFETADGTVEVRRNFFADPLGVNLYQWATTRSSIAPVTNGIEVTASTGSAGNLQSRLNTDTSTLRIPVTPGEPISVSAMGYPSDVAELGIRLIFRTDTSDALLDQPTVYFAPGNRGVVTATVPEGATSLGVWFGNASEISEGQTMTFGEFLLEKSGEVRPFFAPGLPSPDPDLTPEWTGSPNSSPSILTAQKVKGLDGGYQSQRWAASGESSWFLPELEDVAPGFAGYQQGAGVQTVDIGGTLVDRTVYAVGDVIDTGSSYRSWAGIGSTPTGWVQLRTRQSGGSAFSFRFDTVNGSSNAAIDSAYGIREPGRHLLWAGTADGMTGRRGNANSPAPITSGLIPGDGMEASPELRVYTTVSTDAPIAAVAYRGAHTEEQRTAVLGWLHARYMHELLDNQTFLITPRHDGQIVYFNGQEIVTEAGKPVRVYGSGYVGLSPGWWDDQAIVDGEYAGPFFSGDDNPKMPFPSSVEWTGTPNSSTSLLIRHSARIPVGFDTGPWIGGMGHSGCRFVGVPTLTEHNSVDGGQVGYAATFKEVGDWL